MIPDHGMPDDPHQMILDLIASEPAYYAHKDQLYAGHCDAIATGRQPTADERHEARHRRTIAIGKTLASARRIVQAEARRIAREGGAA